MTLKACSNLSERAAQAHRKALPKNMSELDRQQYKTKCAETVDLVNQLSLRALFEDLCLRLQHLRPHDVIRVLSEDRGQAYGQEQYERAKIMNVVRKRNNFFFVGDALRAVLTGGKVHFSNQSLAAFKAFIEERGKETRASVQSKVAEHKNKEELLNFNQVLVQ